MKIGGFGVIFSKQTFGLHFGATGVIDKMIELTDSVLKEYGSLIVKKQNCEIIATTACAAELYGFDDITAMVGENYCRYFRDFRACNDEHGLHLDCHRNRFYGRIYCVPFATDGEDFYLIQVYPTNCPDRYGESLLNLITGMAHEMNTPAGILVTATSTIKAHAVKMMADMSANKLSKRRLKDFLQNVITSNSSIEHSSKHISTLVEQFKRIAIAWSYETLVSFNINLYLKKISASYCSRLKSADVVCHIDCPLSIEIYSDASAFIQLTEELLNNAMLHAFAGRSDNHIDIKITRSAEQITLLFSDNGCGMEADVHRKMFDPFFTTQRHSGNMGLGLSMIFYIVTQRLEGDIYCKTRVDGGTEFSIVFTPAVEEVVSDKNITFFDG